MAALALVRVLTTVAVAASNIVAQAESPPPVRFQLVSDVDAVVPGQTLTLGLWLRHQKDWHTYWKNPGTVGMAPRVEWQLPKGCTAGPLQWQQPQLSKMGVYTIWGYEGEALHLCEIEVPKQVAGTKLEFAAKVAYLVCAKTCQPGQLAVAITLPRRAAAKPDARWRARFRAVRRQQPVGLDDAWQIRARRDGATYTLTLTPKTGANRRIDKLQFYGTDRQVSSDAPQSLRRDAKRLVLTLRREKFSPEIKPRLRGLLYCAAGFRADGTVTAITVDAALSPPPK